MIGGYSRSQVEEALRERDERLERLEREAQLLAGKVVDAERRAAAAGREPRQGTIGGLTRRLEGMQENARRRAQKVRLGARDAMQLEERVGELSSLREELGTLVAELAGLAGVRTPGEEERASVGSEPAASERTYSGPVEVEVGPLRDFAQLTSFEDAVADIDPSSTVQVRNFADGRATFSMSFAQPVELVSELEQRAPFPFSVRTAGTHAVVLDVGETSAA